MSGAILIALAALIIGPLAVLMLAACFLCLRSVWRDLMRCQRGFTPQHLA
jgi:hypothetical protein